jgi:hypothetical protein
MPDLPPIEKSMSDMGIFNSLHRLAMKTSSGTWIDHMELKVGARLFFEFA